MLMFADVDVCRSWNHTMDTDQNVVCESTRILVGSGFCLNKFTVTSYKTTINTTNTCTQKKKHLSPSTRRRNPQRMDQWKAKREAVGDNTTCVQTQTADINPSTDETTQTDQHNSDAQAINTPTVLTKKRERLTQTRCTYNGSLPKPTKFDPDDPALINRFPEYTPDIDIGDRPPTPTREICSGRKPSKKKKYLSAIPEHGRRT